MIKICSDYFVKDLAVNIAFPLGDPLFESIANCLRRLESKEENYIFSGK